MTQLSPPYPWYKLTLPIADDIFHGTSFAGQRGGEADQGGPYVFRILWAVNFFYLKKE